MKTKRSIFSNLFLVVVLLYLALPLAALLLYSVFKEWNGILPSGFTFEFYTKLFSQEKFLPLIRNSLMLAVVSVVICLVLLLLMFYAVIVHFPKMEKYVQMLCMIPYTIQGIILATSLLTVYSSAPGVLSNRYVLLIGAYCIIILPYMYQGIRNSLHTISVNRILESAEILGSGKLYAFFRIILPNILSGITISSLLSVGIIFGDFAIINILASSYIQTLTIYMSKSRNVSGHETSAIVIISFIVMAVLSFAVLTAKARKQSLDAPELSDTKGKS